MVQTLLQRSGVPGRSLVATVIVWMTLLQISWTAPARAIGLDPDRPTLALIGYHEGTRRTVSCKVGVLVGAVAYFHSSMWTYKEPFISAIKLICSSGTLSIEWLPDQPDSKVVFGRDNSTARHESVKCDGTLGIDGFEWRMAGFSDEQSGEMRIAGIGLRCNREGNGPTVKRLDTNPNAVLDQSFSCKKLTQYAGLTAPRVSSLAIWHAAKSIAGIEPLECTG